MAAPVNGAAETADIVVIGGGLIGLTTAHALWRQGRRPLVLEADSEVGHGTSFANGGLLTPSMSDPWNAPGVEREILPALFDSTAPSRLRFAALPSLVLWGQRFLRNARLDRRLTATAASFCLANYSVEVMRTWRGAEMSAFDGAARGSLKVFRDAAAMAGPEQMARALGPRGLRFEVLDAAGAVKIEPRLAEGDGALWGALHFPDDIVGDAYLFCIDLAMRLQSSGVPVRRRARCEGIVAERGRILGVMSAGSFIAAADVVIAAGVGASAMARRLGVRLPIAPVKGYSLTVDMSGVADRPCTPIVDDASHAAIVPIGSRLRVVGTADFAGHDRTIDPARIEGLKRFLRATYPLLASQVDLDTGSIWAGLRPMSADGLPFIGPAGPSGLWINAGHGHLGWTQALGSGRLLANLICGDVPEIDATPYRPDR